MKPSLKRIYLLLYYTQLPLVSIAMVLTATVSAILLQNINWKTVLLVGFATFATYNFDNIIDWEIDQKNYATISAWIPTYHRITYGLIPISATGSILLILGSSSELKITILLLGAATVMGIVRFSNYRPYNPEISQTIPQFIFNRVFISIVWTIVCVFLPIVYESSSMKPQTWSAFIYMNLMIFIYAVLWKFEKSPLSLKRNLLKSSLFKILTCLGILAMLLPFRDVVSGLFPPQDLINVLPPIALIVSVVSIARNPINLRIIIGKLTLSLMLLSTLTMLIFLLT